MVTNFYRISLPFESFQIQRVPYSDDQLIALRKTHNKSASFFRNGDFIYISPSRGSGLEIGELINLKVEESTSIVQSLIRHLIFRTFRESFPDRVPESFSPLRFFSERKEHDAIWSLLPQDLQGLISYPRLVEIQLRQIVEKSKPSFGLLFGSRQRWKFDISLRTLIEERFNLIGKGVLESVPSPGLDNVVAPDESLLGEITSVNANDLEIKTNEGLVRRSIDALHFQKNREQIGAYLSFKLGQSRAEQIFQSINEGRKIRESPGATFQEAKKYASWFSNSQNQPRLYANDDGFCFTLEMNNSFDGPSIPVRRTSLVFDYGPGASADTPLKGLSTFGPFNSARFEKNDLKLLVLFHSQSRGAVTQYLKRLIDGIPESRYFNRGLKSLFHLSSVQYVLKEVNDWSPEAYEKSINEAIREGDTRGFDLALVECPEGSKLTPTPINPYYRARVRLMSYGIPTQGVKDAHLRLPQENLQWTLGPIALQIYAKVGGTPWRLPGTQSVDREILVGIGNAIERPNLWSGAEQSRIVGITTFFLGDGSYMQGERLRSVPYREYFGELLSALRSSITKVAQEYAWKNGDSVRIVFHIFKPIKNIEADVVSRLVEAFPQYNILFAFVTISTEHPWVLFRHASEQNRQFNVALCERGDNLILDSHNCLLQIRGDKDRANKRQRPPHPVLIRIHEKSTYKDLKFIVQQIHDFSFLSWRSFFPSETPVTIFYSSLIATETSKLNKVTGWNSGFLDSHFRHKQWFL